MKPIYKAIFLISFFMFSNLCFGGVVWSWKINNPNIVTDGSENIVFTATIFNHENSEVLKEIDTNLPNEVEALSFLVLDFDNDVFDKYIYDIGELGSGTIRSQFSDVVIEPGESFNFILYTLVPRSSDL
ncbi:MAG: hypothetical protein KJ725_14330 [Gammaproteobacteria bacterium]|nr:hypothetical protein [Gammaproteobacteria bacterium]